MLLAGPDLEGDDLADGATLETEDLDFDQDQQPSRYSTCTPTQSTIYQLHGKAGAVLE